MVEQIKYSLSNELVSSDIRVFAPSIYDSNATIVTDGGKMSYYMFGMTMSMSYSQQVIRLAKYIARKEVHLLLKIVRIEESPSLKSEGLLL